MRTLVFNESTKSVILQIFGKSVDDQGMIIDEAGKRVLDPRGNEVSLGDFAGMKKGSEIFITQDLPSILQYADQAEL